MKSRFSYFSLFAQILFSLLIFLASYFLLSNALENLNRLGMEYGFDFLRSAASFGIGDKIIDYQPSDSYTRALWVGVTNTIRVALPGILLSTIIGGMVGLCRLAKNRVFSMISMLYVECFRNTPLLVQMMIWYYVVFLNFPPEEERLSLFKGLTVSNRGIAVDFWVLDFVMTPEFAALLMGLVVYTSTYVAEIVRSAVRAIPTGQWEAARALGLSKSQAFLYIILPQALRILIPPLSSQYLTLTKNSSLAIAIGYPDLFSISGTISSQTGRVMEMVTIMMLIYLLLSLFTSLLMNLFFRNRCLQENTPG